MGGKYSEMNAEWFERVGVTISFTMMAQMFSIPFTIMVASVVQKLRQWLDRGCRTSKRHTRRSSQEAYNQLYTGAPFMIYIRYAQILTMMFVCLFYSSGMPILYLTTCIQLIFTYHIDKYMLLRICRLPPRIDGFVNQIFLNTLLFMVVTHLGIAIWVTGCQ